MLTVYRSNRAEWLAKVLAEELRNSPPELSETVEVIVNTWPTSRWLGEEIAIVNGINAQITFPFPGAFLRSLVYKVLDSTSKEADPWKGKQLVWQVIRKLPELLETNEASSLKNWMDLHPSSPDEVNRDQWQLARSIADVLDDYILYRPDLINKWHESENQSKRTVEDLPRQIQWQKTLFSLLSSEIHSPPLSVLVKRAIEILKTKSCDTRLLPKHIRLFGITSLAPLQLEFIQALSGTINIDIFLLSPCKDLWQRCRQRRNELGRQWKKPLDGEWLINSARLEATLGRMGAEFQQLLEGSGEYQLGEWKERDLFALPIEIAKNQSREATLLEQLQQKLISNESSELLNRSIIDDSLIFVECPGRRREVQIVRDQVLQWLAKDKDLEPRDILIMTPQIEKFSPLIASVFNDVATTGVDIPWRITDRSELEKPGLIQYMLNLIELAGGRVTASCLDELLSNPAIQQQQGFDQEELAEISNCLQTTGFRWGLDKKERETDNTHSLDWCLERWLLGLILPQDHALTPSGIAPFSEGISIKEIKRWWSILSKVSSHIKEIRQPKICSDWVKVLQKVLEESFGEGGDWAWERKCFLSELENWRATTGNYKLKLNSCVVKEVLQEALTIESGRFGHRSGSLTISALEPMRAIPHRVIILMGLDEDIFPRSKERPGFHLLEQTYKLGDPKHTDQDRYVLLEALMSTRNNLLITWNCRNERNGEHLESAAPIQQWLEYLRSELNVNEFEGILLKPPANPLDPKNFLETEGRPAMSCDHRDIEACKWLNKSNAVKPVALGMPLEWNGQEKESLTEITNEILLDWLTSPQLSWLNQYQLNPKEFNSPILDIENLSLNDLERHNLLYKRLENTFNSSEPGNNNINLDSKFWDELTKGQGILPPKSASQIEIDLLETRWQSLLSSINRVGSYRKCQLKLDNNINHSIWAGDYQIIVEIGKAKNKSIMEGWFNHLLVSSEGIKSKGTILITRKSNEAFEHHLCWSPIQQSQAKSLLKRLRKLAGQGLEQCWPVPPESGWALAKARKDIPSKANKIFAQKWVGEFKIKGERERPEMKLCFGSNTGPEYFIENKSFEKALSFLYEPIINNLVT